MAEAEEREEILDPWGDINLLSCLQGGRQHTEATPTERHRTLVRARRYEWRDSKLYRIMANRSSREVPHPSLRMTLIQQVHETHGHFGRRRTTQMLLLSYWWYGLYRDVQQVLSRCVACDNNKATFNSLQPVLHPLEIRGLMYRWGADLFGPYPASSRGNSYVLVCIEHFSKWVEAFPMPNKTAAEVAYHLQHGVFARFGSPAELVTDGGGEFDKEVRSLLLTHLVDHSTTSSNHPQANGLTERAVGTLKRCLSKSISGLPDQSDWDIKLSWILLGYRVSKQASTKLSPYELIFAVAPSIPSAIKERLSSPLDFNDTTAAEESILARAQALEASTAMAGHHLQIAQHRDTKRYAHIRTGGYLPSVVRFLIGQYVYTRRLDGGTRFDPQARPEILRVVHVSEKGVLRLTGMDGNTIAENAINCSPCHLPIAEDPDTERRMRLAARPDKNLACRICLLPDNEALLLLCDGCNNAAHTYCLKPPLASVPRDAWYCAACHAAGIPDLTAPLIHTATPTPRGQPRKGKANPLRPTPTPPASSRRGPSSPKAVPTAPTPASIVGHRVRQQGRLKGLVEYSVRMEGKGKKDDQWQQATAVPSALIADYKERFPTAIALSTAASLPVASFNDPEDYPTRAQPPALSTPMQQALGYSTTTSLSATIDWQDPAQAVTAMRVLMPGTWTLQQAATICLSCPRGANTQQQTMGLMNWETNQLTSALPAAGISSIACLVDRQYLHLPDHHRDRDQEGAVTWIIRTACFPSSPHLLNPWHDDAWEDKEGRFLDLT